MTATPQLDSSIAGFYTKIISDAWYMDRKDTERLLDILKEMEAEVQIDWCKNKAGKTADRVTVGWEDGRI